MLFRRIIVNNKTIENNYKICQNFESITDIYKPIDRHCSISIINRIDNFRVILLYLKYLFYFTRKA